MFSAPMVRAILDGRKTQTRRIIKVQPPEDALWGSNGVEWMWLEDRDDVDDRAMRCPFGVVGDRLWVRETWKPTGLLAFAKPSDTQACGRFAYAADADQAKRDELIRWRPSIHMPRWASRITLEVTGVRVERLQGISEEDAMAEGVRRWDNIPDVDTYPPGPRFSALEPTSTADCLRTARFAFANLWESINGAGSWDANPWTWVIEFKAVTP